MTELGKGPFRIEYRGVQVFERKSCRRFVIKNPDLAEPDLSLMGHLFQDAGSHCSSIDGLVQNRHDHRVMGAAQGKILEIPTRVNILFQQMPPSHMPAAE